MRKSLVLTACAISILVASSVQAIEIKKPDVSALKNVTSNATSTDSAKSEKSEANTKYQKEYQKTIDTQKKALDAVKTYDKNARLELAKVILTPDQYQEISALKGEDFDNALNSAIVSTLKSETFIQDYSEYTDAQKAAYRAAATKVQIADNRYRNVSNQLTAPLKQIVDGNVSAISAKDELKNAAGLILGIKKNLGTNSDVKKAIAKVNKTNDIVIEIPQNERVVYPRTGVIGSINAQMDDINNTVNNASNTLSKVLLTKEQRDNLIAIQNNKSLSEEERNKQSQETFSKNVKNNVANGTAAENYAKLSEADKQAYQKASGDVIGAVASYTSLGLQCTKLGFNISKNPLIAAPLVFEVGALKDTASLLKSSASNLAKSVSQIKKVNKACGITIPKAEKKSTEGTTSALSKVKMLKK